MLCQPLLHVSWPLFWTSLERDKLFDSLSNSASAFSPGALLCFSGLLETESRFTLFTNEQGGIEDDVIVAVHRDFLLIIGNACNKSKILSRLDAEAAEARGRGQAVTVEAVEDYTLLSVQGPQAMDVMSRAVNLSNADLVRMPFMSSYLCSVEGVACVLTRCGFSGEDGFEVRGKVRKL
ncbi:glycine cleavage T-protein (aminomethyl transferase) domain-containing protein [Toxoplasma gondii FOU]|uniref:Aminomethyltransferase, mitochondrial n=2 Tax=Toxoplasma gondii TaxID=5811 RepID=A0A086KIN1_TOXGO|nr:glycine cleavage T-protein (aminomethyl transferase) domain-containing protein [Toxoplasma gondii FOU]PUA86480.1 aminomethyltransferase [Toxoplasma gondii TgCATBr9]